MAQLTITPEDVGKSLDTLCPDGIDVYFDNVGGTILDEVLARIRLHARIVLCGAIASYNTAGPMPGPNNYFKLSLRRGRMEGFLVLDYEERLGEAISTLAG